MMGGTSDLSRMDELYENIILDHYRNPRHTEPLERPDADVELNNPFCGDEVHVQLQAGGGCIEHISVSGRGCAISQASASILSEIVEGKPSEEVAQIARAVRRMMKGEDISDAERESFGDLIALEGVKMFPVRIKCALLSWDALEDALQALDCDRS